MTVTADRQQKRVLVVDDEPGIIEIVDKYLADEGFLVSTAADGADAVAVFERTKPDLVVLDLKLPVMSGLDAFREMRASSNAPIIILTSKSDEVDKLLGLELGADDYVTKPFSPRELVARVKTVLRRASAAHARSVDGASQADLIRVGDIEISIAEHEARRAGTVVNLTPTEFRILEILAGSPGQTFTRSQLLEMIRGDDLEIFDRTLDRHIANLRHKIEDDASAPHYILTVFGIGYKMARKP
ncbi:MAG TPA: response regulator transcription factor [Candidatus Eremiobacteraceae bacterium]|nr:response regulator transcription factor [Candidatus Eremiobacteraceae bacterium]